MLRKPIRSIFSKSLSRYDQKTLITKLNRGIWHFLSPKHNELMRLSPKLAMEQFPDNLQNFSFSDALTNLSLINHSVHTHQPLIQLYDSENYTEMYNQLFNDHNNHFWSQIDQMSPEAFCMFLGFLCVGVGQFR